VPLCPPEIPYRLAWHLTRTYALRCHWQTELLHGQISDLAVGIQTQERVNWILLYDICKNKATPKGEASSSLCTQQLVRSTHGMLYINHPICYHSHIKFTHRKKGRSSGSSTEKVTETEYKCQGTSLFTYNFVCKMTSFSFQNVSVRRGRLKACFWTERNTSVTVR
jgi:hypothetical protein